MAYLSTFLFVPTLGKVNIGTRRTFTLSVTASKKMGVRRLPGYTSYCLNQGSSSSIGRELLGRNATWTQRRFDEWVRMRTGDDPASPVYWYAIGDVFSAPRGARELIIEGVDVAKTIKLSRTEAVQLSRKIFVFRDVDTNEVTAQYKGRNTPAIRYDYQAIRYSLQDGCLVAETTMGKGDSIVTLRGDRFYWRDIGDGFSICSPLFTERGWIENYDFYGGRNSEYRLSWHGVGPSTIVESGQVVMEMSGLRLKRFEDIPDGLRNFIVEEAPMWQFPPRDMDEVERLQKHV